MNSLFKTITTSHANKKIVPFRAYSDIEHKILIEEVELTMSIGIMDEEKIKPQRVIVNLEIFIEPKADYSEKISNTVSYSDVISNIEILASSKHFCLVETLAREITEECFKNPLVNKVKIQVKKPDVIKNSKAVGFSMVCKKDGTI